MQKEKSYNRNKTFQNRFVLYCWCADWYLGQGSREYRLLCRLRLWLKKFFDGEVEWQKYYDSHYLRVEKSKLYKELVAGYIEKPKKIKTENGFAEELFCLLKQTSHTAVRFCGWELDLREWRALPPHGLRGYGSTAYRVIPAMMVTCVSSVRISLKRHSIRVGIRRKKFQQNLLPDHKPHK